MFISLTALSPEKPIEVGEEEYQRHIARKWPGRGGWSSSSSQIEWLCKLHYLREGYAAGKISREDFLKREQALVLNHWKRFL